MGVIKEAGVMRTMKALEHFLAPEIMKAAEGQVDEEGATKDAEVEKGKEAPLDVEVRLDIKEKEEDPEDLLASMAQEVGEAEVISKASEVDTVASLALPEATLCSTALPEGPLCSTVFTLLCCSTVFNLLCTTLPCLFLLIGNLGRALLWLVLCLVRVRLAEVPCTVVSVHLAEVPCMVNGCRKWIG